jgi:hypothetical protein
LNHLGLQVIGSLKKRQKGCREDLQPLTTMWLSTFESPSPPTLTRLADGFGSDRVDPTSRFYTAGFTPHTDLTASRPARGHFAFAQMATQLTDDWFPRSFLIKRNVGLFNSQ